MRLAVLSMMILCLSVSSASAKFGNAYVARIKSVYDGDTFRVDPLLFCAQFIPQQCKHFMGIEL